MSLGTPEQCLYFSTLMYTDGIHGKTQPEQDETVRDYLARCKQNGTLTCPPEMSQEQWDTMYNTIMYSDCGVGDYIIQDVTQNESDKTWMATFTKEGTNGKPGEAIIAYQGTGGTYDAWHENALVGGGVNKSTGMTSGTTASEYEAYRYSLQMTDKLAGYNISSTGHSKGGNNASVAAIGNDRIAHCYAFDANGFPPEFYNNPIWGTRARENGEKVDYYENENDFVSAILNHLPGSQTHIVHSDYSAQKGFLAIAASDHGPITLFSKELLHGRGELDTSGQEALYRTYIRDFTTFAATALPAEDTDYLMDYIGRFVGEGLGNNDWSAAIEELFADPKGSAMLLTLLRDYDKLPYFLASFINTDGLEKDVGRILNDGLDKIVTDIMSLDRRALVIDIVDTLGQTFQATGKLLLAYGLQGLIVGVTVIIQKTAQLFDAFVKFYSAIVELGHTIFTAMTAWRIRNFTAVRLEQIESISTMFSKAAVFSFNTSWNVAFNSCSFWHRISIEGEQAAVESLFTGADELSGLLTSQLRNEFERAWSCDDSSGSALAGIGEGILGATALMQAAVPV